MILDPKLATNNVKPKPPGGGSGDEFANIMLDMPPTPGGVETYTFTPTSSGVKDPGKTDNSPPPPPPAPAQDPGFANPTGNIGVDAPPPTGPTYNPVLGIWLDANGNQVDEFGNPVGGSTGGTGGATGPSGDEPPVTANPGPGGASGTGHSLDGDLARGTIDGHVSNTVVPDPNTVETNTTQTTHADQNPAPEAVGHTPAPVAEQNRTDVESYNSTITAPDSTIGTYDPVAAALAGTVDIPGLSGSYSGGYDPTQITYQGGHQASAPGDFKRYEDAAFADAERRLNPIWDERDAAFKQEMANRGIAVGSDAYMRALESQNRQRDDAFSTAIYDAMRYGLQAQGQHFDQSHANALLAQQDAMNAMQADVYNNQFGLQAAGMNESARQFDSTYGLNAANARFNQNYANAQMTNQNNQFNANMQRNYANDLFNQQMAGSQFNQMVGQQNFANDMLAAGFNRDSNQMNFANAMSTAGLNFNQINSDFANQLAAANFSTAVQAQDFGQQLALDQLNLAGDAQSWAQQMDAAKLQQTMDQFESMYGLDAARLGEEQRQADMNFILGELGLDVDRLGLQSSIAASGRDNALDWASLGLQERGMIMNLMLQLGAQNIDWNNLLYN